MSAENKKSNIFLTGMMGTGKSTVGKIVARNLGMEFRDPDEMIEQIEGMSVREIFEKHGESYFRARERQVLEKLSLGDRQVIATGGGMLATKENLECAQGCGLVILLKAPEEVLLERIHKGTNRPLLNHHEPLVALKSIATARAEVWDEIEESIETSGKAPSEVAEQVVKIYSRWSEE